MKLVNVRDYVGGWMVGNFEPALVSSQHFEFGVKYFKAGDREPEHFQVIASELSVVVSGTCRIGVETLSAGDGLLIEPGEIAGFEALTDCAIAVIKWPSIPADKVLA